MKIKEKIHQIFAISAFNDNYIWGIVHPHHHTAVIVDPGDADRILDFLQKQHLELEAILLTHHHFDHVNGVPELLKQYSVPVYGPLDERLKTVTHPVGEGAVVVCDKTELNFRVLETPGHTLTHIVYSEKDWLFTGDTLFTGGCGRLFEGTAQQLYDSLKKLMAFPPETHIYCGHEYTQKNLTFAEFLEPENLALQERLLKTQLQRAQGMPTVPAMLEEERQTNPFLRCDLPPLQARVAVESGSYPVDEVSVFATVRRWRDNF